MGIIVFLSHLNFTLPQPPSVSDSQEIVTKWENGWNKISDQN